MGHEPPSRHPHISEENRFRRLFEYSMDAVYIGTPDGTILDVNQAWLDLFGYSRDELSSINAIDFYAHPEERAAFLQRMNETGFVRDEVRYKRKDGSIFLCQRSLVAIRDREGRTVEFQGINRDISEIRAAESALRESETMLVRSQMIGHIGSWKLELSSNRLTWSDETYRIFGIEPQSFAASYEAFLDAVHPDDRKAVDNAYSESLGNDANGYEIEHRIIRRDTGETRHVYEKCVHERSEQGKIVRSVGMVQDITERRKTEQALRESEKKFRTLFEDAPVSILIHDCGTGEIIDANPTACAAYGVDSVDELRETGLWMDPPYSYDEAIAWIRKAATEGPQQFEWLNCTVGGQLFWEQVRLTPVVINDVPRIMAVSVDFTARKNAEEALVTSEERYRTLFENVMDAVCLVSPGGLLLEANQAYLDLFGYTEADVGSINVEQQYLDPHEQTRLLEHLAYHDILVDDEVQLRRYDGTLMNCVRNVVARRDSEGTFIGAQSVIRDVTRQKQVLDELRESEERFMQLARQSRTIAWEIDASGLYTYVGPVIEDVLGYRPEELVHEAYVYDMHPESGREEFKSLMCQIMQERMTLRDFENPMLTREGGVRWFLSSAVPLLDEIGHLRGYRGWDMDITERKEAEAAISASEQRFRSLFEQSRDAIYIGSPDGTVIDVNKAWLNLFGYSREDLPSLNAIDFYANPEDRAEFLKRIAETGVVEDETRFTRKDGSEFDCSRNVVARRDEHGNVLAVQGVLRDITEQKRQRAELEHLARHDTLTGLLNRHAVMEKLSEWIGHSRRYHTELSVLILDIDHFKRINDTHGHAAGDRVLQETASLLISSTRQADFVGRYGGEEFLIILPRTDIEGAAVIAERIRARYEAAPMHVDDDTTDRVTVSLGVTQWHEDDSADSLLARVDAALYRAKEGGRNRVERAQAHSSDT